MKGITVNFLDSEIRELTNKIWPLAEDTEQFCVLKKNSLSARTSRRYSETFLWFCEPYLHEIS